jgi:hypothetical protein
MEAAIDIKHTNRTKRVAPVFPMERLRFELIESRFISSPPNIAVANYFAIARTFRFIRPSKVNGPGDSAPSLP